jgi:ABC-2 type transport system ATP-binding protein
VPRRERRARVDEVLEMVDLRGDESRLASTYSGGMVRRLELAQALVNRPALLVLDEPTVGLDPVARDSVWLRVAQMQRDHGMTVLLTTHYMEEADALCDRVALLHRGTLRALGSPDELKAAAGQGASLEDVFRHHTGAALGDPDVDGEKGGLRGVRATRRTARRLG